MAEINQAEIKTLIERNGEMGVNALSKELKVPLSTMQKYMERQTFFKKTKSRKWDLPERVATGESLSSVDNYQTVIDSQLNGINAMFELLTSNIRSTLLLLAAQKPILQPVASPTINIDPRLSKIVEFETKIQDVFKKQKHNIPETYRDLLFNFDYVGLILKEGQTYANTFLEDEIYELLSGKVQELTEDTLSILKENQITI